MKSGTGTLIVNYDKQTKKCDVSYKRIMQALETGVDVVLNTGTDWLYNVNLAMLYGSSLGDYYICFTGFVLAVEPMPEWLAVSVAIKPDNTTQYFAGPLSTPA